MTLSIDIIDVPKGSHHANRSNSGSTVYDNGQVYIARCYGSAVVSSLYGKELVAITVDVIPGVLEIKIDAWEGSKAYTEALEVLESMPARRVPNPEFEKKVIKFAWAKARTKKALNWEGIINHIFEEGIQEGKSQKASELRKLIEL